MINIWESWDHTHISSLLAYACLLTPHVIRSNIVLTSASNSTSKTSQRVLTRLRLMQLERVNASGNFNLNSIQGSDDACTSSMHFGTAKQNNMRPKCGPEVPSSERNCIICEGVLTACACFKHFTGPGNMICVTTSYKMLHKNKMQSE